MSQLIETRATPPDRDFVAPSVNIHRTTEGYTLEAELPGVTREGVEITFEGGKLTLVGRRTPSPDGAIYRESPEADYRRSFDLDPSVDASRIEAGIEQGLLVVRLPKAESARPRRIDVR